MSHFALGNEKVRMKKWGRHFSPIGLAIFSVYFSGRYPGVQEHLRINKTFPQIFTGEARKGVKSKRQEPEGQAKFDRACFVPLSAE